MEEVKASPILLLGACRRAKHQRPCACSPRGPIFLYHVERSGAFMLQLLRSYQFSFSLFTSFVVGVVLASRAAAGEVEGQDGEGRWTDAGAGKDSWRFWK